MDIENKQIDATAIPSFTLYPITTQDLKTCFESNSYKIICSLNGPYYDKKITHLQPHFNISIASSSHLNSQNYTPQQLNKFQRKLQQILNTMIVKDKYQRMIFDINMQIIQTNYNNPRCFVLPPLVNLLSYTCMLKCLQIYSVFTCSAAIYSEQQIVWEREDKNDKNGDKYLVLCNDQRDKKTVMILFDGEFNYVHYQKLSGVLQEANEEIAKFQQQKVNEVFELFHQ